MTIKYGTSSSFPKTRMDGPNVKPSSNNAVLQWCKAILFTVTFMVWGMTVSVQSCTFPDLRIRLNVTVNGIAYALAIGYMGKLCGGLFAVITDRFGKASDVMLAGMLSLASVTFLLIPFCVTTERLGICVMITHLGFYYMQAAVHSQITSLWATGGKPVRYALYMGFGLGSLFGLLLSQPFISGVRGFDHSDLINTALESLNDTPVAAAAQAEAAVGNLTTTQGYFQIIYSPSRDLSTIEYAYIIVFTLGIIVAAAYVCCHFIGQLSGTLYKLEKPLAVHSWASVISPREWARDDVKTGVLVAAMLVSGVVLQKVLNLGTDMYLRSFATDSDLGFNDVLLFRLSTLVALAGALGNLTGMISARFVSIRYMLVVVTAGQTLLALLCLIIGSKHVTSLMVLAPWLFFFREAVVPTLIAWGSHYMLIYGFLVGMAELISGLIAILYVPLQDYLYTSVALHSIFATTLGFACALFFFTWLMFWFSTFHDSYAKRLRNFYTQNRDTLPPLCIQEPITGDLKEKTGALMFYVECKEMAVLSA